MADFAIEDQSLKQFEGSGIGPLKVIEKESERVFRPRKDVDEPVEDQVKAILVLVGGKIWNCRLLTNDEGQFWDEVDDELTAPSERIGQRLSPPAQLAFASPEQFADEA